MIAKPLTQLSLRLIVAWLLVSIFFFVSGEWVVRALLPYLTAVTNMLAHNYTTELSISNNSTGKIIAIVATATEDVYRLEIPIAPIGTRINGSGTLMHALVPIVILYTILIAWPAALTKLFTHIVLGVPATLCMLALTTPMLLLSHIEQVFHTAAQNYAGKELPLPFMMNWVVFMELGGMWLLPMVFSFLCIKLSAFFVFGAKRKKV